MSTNEACPCGKSNCEGVNYHDDLVDRRMTDLATLKLDASTDLDMSGDIKGRISGIKTILQTQYPFCSPVFQGRIDSALALMSDFQAVKSYGSKPSS